MTTCRVMVARQLGAMGQKWTPQPCGLKLPCTEHDRCGVLLRHPHASLPCWEWRPCEKHPGGEPEP